MTFGTPQRLSPSSLIGDQNQTIITCTVDKYSGGIYQATHTVIYTVDGGIATRQSSQGFVNNGGVGPQAHQYNGTASSICPQSYTSLGDVFKGSPETSTSGNGLYELLPVLIAIAVIYVAVQLVEKATAKVKGWIASPDGEEESHLIGFASDKRNYFNVFRVFGALDELHDGWGGERVYVGHWSRQLCDTNGVIVDSDV